MFVLVVDDFGVQYTGQEHADHLHSCIKDKYKCTYDKKETFSVASHSTGTTDTDGLTCPCPDT
jgi:DNA replication protein DnaC